MQAAQVSEPAAFGEVVQMIQDAKWIGAFRENPDPLRERGILPHGGIMRPEQIRPVFPADRLQAIGQLAGFGQERFAGRPVFRPVSELRPMLDGGIQGDSRPTPESLKKRIHRISGTGKDPCIDFFPAAMTRQRDEAVANDRRDSAGQEMVMDKDDSKFIHCGQIAFGKFRSRR